MHRLAPLLMLVVIAVPGASAQLLLDVPQTENEPIRPETERREVTVPASIPCQDLFPQDPRENRRVFFQVASEHTGLIVQGSDVHVVPTNACPTRDGAHEFEQAFSLSATREVPGEEVVRTEFEAWLTAGTHPMVQPESPRAHTTLASAVAFEGRIVARVDHAVFPTAGEARAPVHIENVGNARTALHAQLVGQSGPGTVVPPAAVILESPNQGGDHTDIVAKVVFKEPDGAWSETKAILELTPESTKTGDPGEPVQVELVFRNTGGLVGETVPAPPFAVLAVALAAIGAVLRRR